MLLMGSLIEFNDTLQISVEQGFPSELLSLEAHRRRPFTAADFEGKVFSFYGKEGARIFHPAPTRCFLVQNIGGKWLYWGKILMVEQTIFSAGNEQTTSGKFRIIEIYEPAYQEQVTKRESPEGKSYF
jgi:hypothetical protein